MWYTFDALSYYEYCEEGEWHLVEMRGALLAVRALNGISDPVYLENTRVAGRPVDEGEL